MEKKGGGRFDANVQRTAAKRVLLNKEAKSTVAREIGCSAQAVITWVKKFRNELLGETPSTSSVVSEKTPRSKKRVVKQVTAVAVSSPTPKTLPHPSNDRPQIELVTKGGTTLRLPVETPFDTLCRVIKRLDEGK